MDRRLTDPDAATPARLIAGLAILRQILLARLADIFGWLHAVAPGLDPRQPPGPTTRRKCTAPWAPARVRQAWLARRRRGGKTAVLAAPLERHLGRLDVHEQHVGVERQARHVADGRAAVLHVEHRLRALTSPLACGTPAFMRPPMAVSALPMSSWPQAMSCLRPSSAMHLVSPVMACLVAV